MLLCGVIFLFAFYASPFLFLFLFVVVVVVVVVVLVLVLVLVFFWLMVVMIIGDDGGVSWDGTSEKGVRWSKPRWYDLPRSFKSFSTKAAKYQSS